MRHDIEQGTKDLRALLLERSPHLLLSTSLVIRDHGKLEKHRPFGKIGSDRKLNTVLDDRPHRFELDLVHIGI